MYTQPCMVVHRVLSAVVPEAGSIYHFVLKPTSLQLTQAKSSQSDLPPVYWTLLMELRGVEHERSTGVGVNPSGETQE